VLFWLAPEMVAQGPGWEVTPNAIAFGQVVGVEKDHADGQLHQRLTDKKVCKYFHGMVSFR
jgi:hypothetical protein